MFYYKFKYTIFGIEHEYSKLNVIKYDTFLGCEGEA